MSQRGHDLRFPLEALQKLRLIDQMWLDNLDGNLALGVNLARSVHSGHAPFTQEGHDLELSQALTDQVCHAAEYLALRLKPLAGDSRHNPAKNLSIITSC